MRKINLSSVVISRSHRCTLIPTEDIDTGVSDGSGSFTVRAGSAQQATARSVVFHNVEIEVEGDYETWSSANLNFEAERMLAQDYIKGSI